MSEQLQLNPPPAELRSLHPFKGYDQIVKYLEKLCDDGVDGVEPTLTYIQNAFAAMCTAQRALVNAPASVPTDEMQGSCTPFATRDESQVLHVARSHVAMGSQSPYRPDKVAVGGFWPRRGGQVGADLELDRHLLLRAFAGSLADHSPSAGYWDLVVAEPVGPSEADIELAEASGLRARSNIFKPRAYVESVGACVEAPFDAHCNVNSILGLHHIHMVASNAIRLFAGLISFSEMNGLCHMDAQAGGRWFFSDGRPARQGKPLSESEGL
jgi:hypothetical protein